MRILFALNSYRPNIDGVGVSIERQALGLRDLGHEPAIVAPARRLAEYEEERAGLRIFRVRALKVLADSWRLPVTPAQSVERILEQFQPDLAVVCIPFFLQRATWTEARLRGIPVVGITGMMPENLRQFFPFLRAVGDIVNLPLWKLIVDYYNACDFVVAVTRTALRLLEEHGLRQPATVISNGVQLDRFRPRPRHQRLAGRLGIPDKPTVLYTGRLDPEKAMDVWVKAIPRVLDRLDCHFVIGGDGKERAKLAQLADQLGVGDHVTFTGFLSDKEYPFVYSLADVFAITSPSELQSIVTLEAAASGLPVVAANAGGLPEIARDGVNARLVPPLDAEATADAVVELLQNRELRERFGRASRDIAHGHDIQGSIAAYDRVYREVLGTRRSLAAVHVR